MNINWKKSLLVVCDIIIAAYLILAITAFNKPDMKATTCTEVKIDIADSAVDGFLNAGEVKKLLTREKLYPLSKPWTSINPRTIEETLEKLFVFLQGLLSPAQYEIMKFLLSKWDKIDSFEWEDDDIRIKTSSCYTGEYEFGCGCNEYYRKLWCTSYG